ncbi:porin [Vibrio alfacsensis]|uniref:porin n=1 Tax=Vibrio alfacsensis TaxID=1074311 RepID=UPI00406823F2
MKKIPLSILSSMIILTPDVHAANTDYELGGMIKAMLIADSNLSGVGPNVLPELMDNYSDQGGIALDGTLTRLNFKTNTDLESGDNVSSFIAFDFNKTNDSKAGVKLREAYVTWNMGNGTLLAGQTWSTLMDMRNVPTSLSEPVLSGVAFMRQPMVRWTQNFDNFGYTVALESGSNSTIASPDLETVTQFDNTSSLPDLHAAVETVHDLGWFRASGMVNRIKATVNEQKYTDTGYAIELSGGINISPQDKFTMIATQAKGNERYFLGIGGGPTINPAKEAFDIHKTQGLMASYNREWSDKVTSVFAYGSITSDALGSNANTVIGSNYGFANVNWEAVNNLFLGAEYVYAENEKNNGEKRDNHRLMLVADYRF